MTESNTKAPPPRGLLVEIRRLRRERREALEDLAAARTENDRLAGELARLHSTIDRLAGPSVVIPNRPAQRR
jgi:hypothetical protein